MTSHADDHERTMAFAEMALGQMRALRQPAFPRHYEIWYTYATGYNPSLNQMINETLTRNGNLSDVDIDRIYDSYLSPTRFPERIDRVGTQLMEEIDQVLAMITAAVGSATSYGKRLGEAIRQLERTKDRQSLRAIIANLVTTANAMAESNETLEARLSASRQEINHLQEDLEAVRTESLTDPLTSLANRKYFDDALKRTIADCAQKGEPLALMISDVDHFKAFNDNFGHLTGDQVLRLVAMSVKQSVKSQDIAARYGGEEFAVVLPNTELRCAVTVADQIRRTVMTKELLKRSTGEHLGRLTISIGVAALRESDTAQTLIERADACLYAAKRGGRNRVVSETDPDVTEVVQIQVA
jgi:diguanylate cyclase